MEDETFEDIARRLRQNEAGYSCLELKMNPGFEARDIYVLTEAVLANQTLESVDFFGILADDDVNEATRLLVESFATLPMLKSLKFFGYCEEFLATLTHLLNERVQTLQHLNMTYVQLDGPDEILASFCQSLQSLSNLKSFHLLDCQFSERLRDENALDQIVGSLSQLPSLVEVEIRPIQSTSLGAISTEALIEVCQSRNLSTLRIYGFQFPDTFPHLESMLSTLRTSRAIQVLSFQSSFSEDYCNSIANLIRGTTSLLKLNVDMIAEQNDTHIVKIAEALRENTSLKTLGFQCLSSKYSFKSATLVNFGKLLETNYSVEIIGFCSAGTGIQQNPMISMYLKLNQLGRGDLIQNDQTSRQQWVDKLLEAHDYLDGLYYFLSMNPSLCEKQD